MTLRRRDALSNHEEAIRVKSQPSVCLERRMTHSPKALETWLIDPVYVLPASASPRLNLLEPQTVFLRTNDGRSKRNHPVPRRSCTRSTRFRQGSDKSSKRTARPIRKARRTPAPSSPPATRASS